MNAFDFELFCKNIKHSALPQPQTECSRHFLQFFHTSIVKTTPNVVSAPITQRTNDRFKILSLRINNQQRRSVTEVPRYFRTPRHTPNLEHQHRKDLVTSLNESTIYFGMDRWLFPECPSL